jgi:hypothetical protein
VNSFVDAGLDRECPLPNGMELEFELVEVEGGRLQATRVTRPGFAEPASEFRGAIKGIERFRSVPALSDVIVPPPASAREAANARTIAERVSAERTRIEAERVRFDSEAQRHLHRAEAAEAQLPDVVRDFEEKIAELESERDRQITQLRGDVEKYKAQAVAAAAARDALPAVSVASAEILAEHLRSLRTDLGTWLDRRLRSNNEIGIARRAAVAAVGEEDVAEYEEIRRRRSTAPDTVAATAYALAEKTSRLRLPTYAEALDGLRATEISRVHIVVVAAPCTPGRLLLLAPLAPEDAERGDDVRWRVASFLFDAAERAAREMDADVTIGRALDCLVADLRPWGAEPELVGIALQEAWEARPTLAAAPLTMGWELVPGVELPVVPFEQDAEAVKSVVGASATGGDLRTVARRLRLPLADLIAGLQGAGLPFPDDSIDAGVEESIRQLLHLEEEPKPAIATRGEVTAGPSVDSSSSEGIARRLLQKLLRDARIGGRHTNAAHVWGHHFADDEKDLAREIMSRLVRRGILLSKRKPSGEHVSIDPRRMDDVKRIVDLKYTDSSLYEPI